MAYTTLANVRLLTNLTSSDISDSDLTSIITEVTRELNRMMNVLVVRERIDFIDETRTNYVNGSNKTYYIKNWKGKFFADMDNDGDIDTLDIIVYAIASDGTEAVATVNSITHNLGKFTLDTAYSSDYELYITYEWCYRDESTPDPLVKLACTLLSAAYCYAKINIGRAPQVAFGNTKIYRHLDSFNHYYNRFLKIVSLINDRSIDLVEPNLV